MELENIFLKYIPIFNWMGESRIVVSDFSLSNPSSKKLRLINILVITSLLLTVTLSLFNTIAYIKYFPQDSGTPQIVFVIMFAFRTITKFSSLFHMYSWARHFPKLYIHFKDIQRVSESRYQMDFREFQAQFDHEVTLVFILWSTKIIIYFVNHSDPIIIGVIFFNESIVLFLNHVVFFHIYFYMLLFKSIITFYIGYVEHKATVDKPKTVSDLRVELIFIKTINFKLHEISKVLNAAFGWILVWILIQKFSEVVGNLFWTYGNLSCQTVVDVIRNYK